MLKRAKKSTISIYVQFGVCGFLLLGPAVTRADSTDVTQAACPQRSDFYTLTTYSDVNDADGHRVGRSAHSSPNLMYVSLISRATRTSRDRLCATEVQALDDLFRKENRPLPKSFSADSYFAQMLGINGQPGDGRIVQTTAQGYKYYNGNFEQVGSAGAADRRPAGLDSGSSPLRQTTAQCDLAHRGGMAAYQPCVSLR